ncbi:cadherin-like protein 26 [Archocentrus centrarchus]|uniref:cadherin-like protein 26 n=1 Tax=Archocentrus centrarchus TaxID=63155 RepID=UPI0011EA00E9|nr:cadherin-like protein 26 [Archocentrus centrarchus]
MQVALAAMAECYNVSKYSRRSIRDLLVRSKRRWVLSTIKFQEELEAEYPVEISRMYNDKIVGKDFRFVINGDGVPEVFTIDESTGAVFAHKKVDREINPLYHIKFDVLDRKTGEKIDTELAFNVAIQDINDNPPKFTSPEITTDVKESITERYLPVALEVRDIDQANTPNSEVTITMLSQTPLEPKINVEQSSGGLARLTLKGCFDYDKANKYKIVVEAKDHGTKPKALSSTAVVNLNIVDSNTHQPRFKERQYKGEAMEMTTNSSVLRVAVEDKDTPNTDAWRAKYFIIAGNEEGIYNLETDPKTNEGILSIIKKKNYERTTLINLQIGVKNIEDIFVCAGARPPADSVNITLKISDTNDPPEFEKVIANVYLKEEEEPGKVLFTPKVKDVDSNIARFVLVDDPANWMTIDGKTGEISATKKMDRESPFVDHENVYKVIIAAIDDGEPPATSTCTVNYHLQDINDNTPRLLNNSTIICGNKNITVMLRADDSDAYPYSGPFSFSLGGDETLKQQWKLEPDFGEEVGLVSLKTLPYRNYSIPLVIMDQQNFAGHETLELTVCECKKNGFCHIKKPLSISFGAAGIRLAIAGLLVFLLLLLTFLCEYGPKKFECVPEDEGNQTLILYNQEGGGSPCTTEPTFFQTPTDNIIVTDGLKQATMKRTETPPCDIEHGKSSVSTMFQSPGMYQQRETPRSHGARSTMRYSTWQTNRTNTYRQGRSSIYQHSLSLRSDQHLENQIDRSLHMVDGNLVDYPVDQPCTYAFEGKDSLCQSLDELSFNNLGDDLQFLDDLGPKFQTLGQLCNQTTKK